MHIWFRGHPIVKNPYMNNSYTDRIEKKYLEKQTDRAKRGQGGGTENKI